MRPDGVVFLLPDSDDVFGMVEGIELVHAETFVTDFPVEGFHEAVSQGLPARDEDRFCFASPTSRQASGSLMSNTDIT